ncbi:MAG: AraC family transcriptional regulator ligand-binding domain-containing protein [Saprospiraceae bacterium]
MIVIPYKFTGILEEWLKYRGLYSGSEFEFNTASNSTLTLQEWTEVIHSVTTNVSGTALGLEIGQFIQLQHAGPLGYLIVNNKVFGQLLETYELFEKWFYGENWLKKEITDTTINLIWDNRVGFPDRLFEQVNSMALVTVISKICPTVGYPIEVDVMNEEAGESADYYKAFNCQVRFSEKAMRLSYPLIALNQPKDKCSEIEKGLPN